MERTSIQSEAASDNHSPGLASEFKRVTVHCASLKTTQQGDCMIWIVDSFE